MAFRPNIFGSQTYKPSFNIGSLDDPNDPSNAMSGFDFTPKSGQLPVPSTNDKKLDMSDVYRKIMDWEAGPEQQKYRQFLQEETPRREDYQPTKMGRLAAMLTGFGEGVQRGGASGAQAAQAALEAPYRSAMDTYRLKGEKLAKAAELEEKNVGNRVKTAWDVLRAQSEDEKLKAGEPLRQAQTQYYQARATDLGGPKAVGSPYINPITGIGSITVKDPTSPGGFKTVDLGQRGPTGAETAAQAGAVAGSQAKARLPSEQALEGTRQANRVALEGVQFKNRQDLKVFEQQHPNYTRIEAPGADVQFVDPSGNLPTVHTGIASTAETPAQKEERAKRVKIAPGAPQTVISETRVSPEGDEKRTVTQRNPKAKTSNVIINGQEYPPGTVEMVKDGKSFPVNPAEVAQAEAAGFKRK